MRRFIALLLTSWAASANAESVFNLLGDGLEPLEDGAPVTMSKRAGQFVTASDHETSRRKDEPLQHSSGR